MLRAAVLAVLAVLAAAAPAGATEVHIAGSAIVVTGTPGVGEQIDYAVSGNGPSVYGFDDNSGGPASAAAPCRVDQGTLFTCPTAGITSVRFDLGDGDDSAYPEDGAGATLATTILGGAGNDHLGGTIGADTIDGGAGSDRIYGDTGDDVLTGGDGDDQLNGNAGDDTVDGGSGDDAIIGGDGNDDLIGGAGIDRITADAGDDQVDLRDGEKEVATTTCDEGDDTVLADPFDQVAEFRVDGGWMVEVSCEHLPGQPAPKPVHLFQSGPLHAGRVKITTDMIEAFRGRLRIELVASRRMARRWHGATKVGSGTLRYHPGRTTGHVKLTRRFAKALRGTLMTVTAVVTNTDSAGRKSTARKRFQISGL